MFSKKPCILYTCIYSCEYLNKKLVQCNFCGLLHLGDIIFDRKNLSNNKLEKPKFNEKS